VTLSKFPKTFIQDYVFSWIRIKPQHQGLGATERAKLQQQVTIRIPEAGISKVFPTDSRDALAIIV